MQHDFFRSLYRLCILVCLLPLSVYSQNSSCHLPRTIQGLVSKQGARVLQRYPDIARNRRAVRGLCSYLLSFREGAYRWDMLLVLHPKATRGAFWFLPHDNENSAFDSAVYAVRKYGGGFLSVLSGGSRYHQG